jgi:hypothetical protein
MSEIDPDEFNRRRKSRSLVTALLLLALVALFYMLTLARIQG